MTFLAHERDPSCPHSTARAMAEAITSDVDFADFTNDKSDFNGKFRPGFDGTSTAKNYDEHNFACGVNDDPGFINRLKDALRPAADEDTSSD